MARSHHKPLPAHVTDTSLLGIKFHQGPIPSPADFAAYEQAQPGAADRILAMAERDQIARIRDQRAERLIKFALDVLAQLFLFGLIGAAVYLALNNKPLEAFFAGLAPIAAIIYANTRKKSAKPHDDAS